MKSDEWCNSGKEQIVPDDKKHRCSVCGRRLNGCRGLKILNYEQSKERRADYIYQLPPHKKKGYKIKRKKGHNQKVHNKRIPYKNDSIITGNSNVQTSKD
jgi:hypothetical protein